MAAHFDIVIIGGGAAGLCAAVAAAEVLESARHPKSVAIVEAGARVGKKLLATGNGRCNLTNKNVSPAYYHGDTDCLPSILKQCTPDEIIRFFYSHGLLCREQDEGRVYPFNLQAAAVLDTLRTQLERYRVEVVCDFPVTDVEKNADGFRIHSEERIISAGEVLFATGGLAYPQLGANGGGYEILQRLGHSCSELLPSLVQVKTDARRAKPLKGARSAANATLLANGKPVKTVRGEVQFTEQGLSGICIFELSRSVGERYGKQTLEIELDFMPDYTEREIVDFLHSRTQLGQLPSLELLNGCLNKLVGPEVVKAALPRVPKAVGELSDRELAVLAHTVKHFHFSVTGTLSWRDAQVTAGGVPLKEIDETMQSKICPGLFLAGELLNIDGDCGGFNLHWAWSTGLIAGRAAARRLLESQNAIMKSIIID